MIQVTADIKLNTLILGYSEASGASDKLNT